jgi:prepilin-type N-terminal cleavage/methylation domain-containing protein
MGITRMPHRSVRRRRSAGFTLIELMMVVAIIMIAAGVSMPPLLAAIAHTKLRGSSSSLSGLIQRSRMHAVKRNKTVILKFVTDGDARFAVVKDVDDTSTDLKAADPQVLVDGSLTQVSVPSGGVPALTDTVLGYTPLNLPDLISFNSRGLPCKYEAPRCTTAGFVYYLTDTDHQNFWTAVSVSPGGRVKQWFWNGTAWGD